VTARLSRGGPQVVALCAVFALAVGGCSGSTQSTQPAAGARFVTAATWMKPAQGCPANAFASADVCAVCNPKKRAECEERCARGEGDACTVAGVSYSLFAEPPAKERAADFYERGCALGSGEGCELFGKALTLGEGRVKDQAAGADLLERMCAAGRGSSCTAAAVAHLTGHGRAQDAAKGMKLFGEACDKHDVEACWLQEDPRVRIDLDAAQRASRQKMFECARGDVESCRFGQRPLSDLRRVVPPSMP